ncbi:RNA 2',3'-cyclic phosphodiesterase [Streptomyces pluripotens]|uniref:RNA 2',3'-cyclic phosphodiesterase n=1 Tax=Streptomyces pluripotens TaxID=1355015 RepID=A0A221P197_9ACTN|nr:MULTISPECIES: RNA 2',3'-cyclic phosphodiesterase [Streptomyces]ARP71604.1 2'-5' RNA ligase [Streptomyces pluripotens]ASN25856.1 RNA 2',3'-cyclic phosphodiesterase [Streptomyces pluripotens]KIE27498.1 2'-5' RNA ligase [Streptomyces sp. MUSC 125]MCH0557532.1 RNA 2',3'-cyclic phosphodiesterase [Streptomyces sp. MUM 16J]
MRLFAAVLPPDDVARELAKEVARLKRLPGAERLRWTSRPGWHFTLAFYGEVADELVPGLSERLERAARRSAPLRLALSGGGQFGRGKILWTGAQGDVKALRLLAGRAEAAARRAGVPMTEHRRYLAHLTLARGRDGADTRPCVAALADFTTRAWTVADLALVRSELPRSGVPGEQPRYETVARWVLGGSG